MSRPENPKLPFDPFFVDAGKRPMISSPDPTGLPPPLMLGEGGKALAAIMAAAAETKNKPRRAIHWVRMGEHHVAEGRVEKGIRHIRIAHDHDPVGRWDKHADLVEGLVQLFTAAQAWLRGRE